MAGYETVGRARGPCSLGRAMGSVEWKRVPIAAWRVSQRGQQEAVEGGPLCLVSGVGFVLHCVLLNSWPRARVPCTGAQRIQQHPTTCRACPSSVCAHSRSPPKAKLGTPMTEQVCTWIVFLKLRGSCGSSNGYAPTSITNLRHNVTPHHTETGPKLPAYTAHRRTQPTAYDTSIPQ